jgi:menaquinone reductase, molybdopterin-binding-like subunit
LAAAATPPAVLPLHNTRSMPDVLLEVARRLGGEIAAALPWKSYQDQVRAASDDLANSSGVTISGSAGDFWNKMLQQGGWWGEKQTAHAARHANPAAAERQTSAHSQSPPSEPAFDGPESEFPLHLLPYPSPTMYDGSLAHLPWMQETPDPLSTAMWGTWVEMNPRTAERLGVRQRDLVEVRSRHGVMRAPALLTPGIAPDVVAVPIGQGHQGFGRYAAGRGANPLAILAPLSEPATGSFAWAATRVNVTRAGPGNLILFAARIQEQPSETQRR